MVNGDRKRKKQIIILTDFKVDYPSFIEQLYLMYIFKEQYMILSQFQSCLLKE